jgi:hypothetical protein
MKKIPCDEPEAPEWNMVPCWCSRPTQCSAVRKPCRPCAAGRRKRVVVSLADTLQKCDGRPSPEQVKSTGRDVPEALLFHLVCAQETERELLYATGDVVVLQAREMTGRWRGPYIGHYGEARFRGGVEKPADREAVLGETPVIKDQLSFPINWTTSVLMETEWKNLSRPIHSLAACLPRHDHT